MKKLNYFLFITVLSGVFTSCNTEPEPIRYGEDACHFCKMTIVSQAHASRAVSTKGKQFKYDAIECMVNGINKNKTEMALMQVSNYMEAGSMIDVGQASFVINDSINSPMGANLAAVKKNTAVGSDDLLTWEELKARLLQ